MDCEVTVRYTIVYHEASGNERVQADEKRVRKALASRWIDVDRAMRDLREFGQLPGMFCTICIDK